MRDCPGHGTDPSCESAHVKTRRYVVDKVTRRAHGEPPGVPLSPPGPPNLVVGAFVNLIWLSAIFILLAWATGSSLGGTQAGNQADLSGKVVLIRLGFGVLVLVVAR